MQKHARAAGYSVALALLAGLLWLVGMLREDILFPHNRVKVSFPLVGTLMQDDPVKLKGVQTGRVAKIEAGEGVSIVTLEFFYRTPLTKGSRFINYNYSLFGARMVILVPGNSSEPLDASVIQSGDFSTGVAETIHQVEDLMRTVIEYKNLSTRLEKGTDSSLSLQQFLVKKVYPVLEQVGTLTKDLEILQSQVSVQLEKLAQASTQVDRLGRDLSIGSDTLMLKANRTLEQLATLTTQATTLLNGLEKIVVASQDTTKGPGRLLMRREMYDQAMSLTHALQELLKIAKQEGLQESIQFWRNIHFRSKRQK